MGERLVRNEEARGSNPLSSTTAPRALRRLPYRELTAAGYCVQGIELDKYVPDKSVLDCVAERQLDLLIRDIDTPIDRQQ